MAKFHLINTYQDDFTKYAGKLSITHLEEVLHAVPKLLTQQFVYSHAVSNSRHLNFYAVRKAFQTGVWPIMPLATTDLAGLPIVYVEFSYTHHQTMSR